MSDDLPPIPAAAPSSTRLTRPPVPGWLWLLFGLGMIPVGAVLSLASFGSNSGSIPQLVLAGAAAGMVCGLPLLGGLALAGRFFSGVGGRILGGLMFTCLLLVGIGAVGFAGCLCLMQGGGSFH